MRTDNLCMHCCLLWSYFNQLYGSYSVHFQRIIYRIFGFRGTPSKLNHFIERFSMKVNEASIPSNGIAGQIPSNSTLDLLYSLNMFNAHLSQRFWEYIIFCLPVILFRNFPPTSVLMWSVQCEYANNMTLQSIHWSHVTTQCPP